MPNLMPSCSLRHDADARVDLYSLSCCDSLRRLVSERINTHDCADGSHLYVYVGTHDRPPRQDKSRKSRRKLYVAMDLHKDTIQMGFLDKLGIFVN